jgi:hypothetical protein
LTKKVSTPQI